jgi:multidrug resistance protein, MATE family
LKLFTRTQQRFQDYRPILILALPLMLNNIIEAVLTVTDTWFVGHISAEATAALSAATWPSLLLIILMGGVGIAVQTLAARAFGAEEFTKAARHVWNGIGVSILLIPIFYGLASLATLIFSPFGLPSSVLELIQAWWKPRLGAGSLAVIFGCLTGFFNAINQTKITLLLTVLLGIVNIPFNYLFIYYLKWGIAGSAWGSNLALLFVCLIGLFIFTSKKYATSFQSRHIAIPSGYELKQLIQEGLGLGMVFSVDLFGWSLFQLMQARLGVIQGAATQIAMTLASFGYLPILGIASAGTTLVGQAFGAKASEQAYRVGNQVIRLSLSYMGLISLVFIVLSKPLSHLFITPDTPHATEIAHLVRELLWFVAAYQLFDGLNLSAGFCLRGAGDLFASARLYTAASFLVLVPLCHTLTFNPQQAWIKGLPQAGWGVKGGWTSVIFYNGILSLFQYLRWRSRVWQKKFI